MKLTAGTQYRLGYSRDRTVQVDVTPGSTATLSVQLVGAEAPVDFQFTESALIGDVFNHCDVSVSGAGCSFTIQPDSDINEIN